MQGSPEWHAARLGKVTASRVADVIATNKTGYSTSRANYMAELALVGDGPDSYQVWVGGSPNLTHLAFPLLDKVFIVIYGCCCGWCFRMCVGEGRGGY